MSLFGSIAKEFFGSNKEKDKKAKIQLHQEISYLGKKESIYASSYANPFSTRNRLKKIASRVNPDGVSGESISSSGSFNGKLLGYSDYKGPDSTNTPNPWSGDHHFSTGVKNKIKIVDKWDDIVLKHSQKVKIDTMLVKVIIVLESSGIPDLISSDGYGSIGLTQITPSCVGVDVDVDVDKLKDPDYNKGLVVAPITSSEKYYKDITNPLLVRIKRKVKD
jgi:Transglycosylase SLT domain.